MVDRAARAVKRILQITVGLALVGSAVVDFVRIDRASHSASDTLVAWVPHAGLLALAGWAVIAAWRQPARHE